MVTNKEFESAVRTIARWMGRTCGEMVRYKETSGYYKGKTRWRLRGGTVAAQSLGASNWGIYVAPKDGGVRDPFLRGKKGDIVRFANKLKNVMWSRSKPRPMTRLKSSGYGDVYGRVR